MNENMNDGVARAGARRRLIRGAFSAPAVLTLYSGSVAAASVLCSEKTPVDVPLVTSAEDTFLRVQLWGLIKKSNNKVESYWVQGSAEELVGRVTRAFQPKNGEWQRMATDWSGNPTGMTEGACTSLKPGSSKDSKSPKDKDKDKGYRFERVNKWVVLRVDSHGSIVGVGGSGPGLLASDSCAASLAGAAILRG
ncbi:MAG TPA: hypothetical protein PKB14_15580 [Rubrivivax sp.]|nr:hypothetical protein [Rubrivivax sp.]